LGDATSLRAIAATLSERGIQKAGTVAQLLARLAACPSITARLVTVGKTSEASLIRTRASDAFLYAFDLLDLDGEDLHARRLSERKARPAPGVRRPGSN
jgi:hypothetical protein